MERLIVNEGQGPKSHELVVSRMVVGATPDCDVRLRHPAAAGCQFVIERTPHGHRAVRLTGELLVNERPCDVADLAHNDTLRVGESMVLYKNPAATRPASPVPSPAAPPEVLDEIGVEEVAETEAWEELAELEELEELTELAEMDEPGAPAGAPALGEVGERVGIEVPAASRDAEPPAVRAAPAVPAVPAAPEELEELEVLEELEELEEPAVSAALEVVVDADVVPGPAVEAAPEPEPADEDELLAVLDTIDSIEPFLEPTEETASPAAPPAAAEPELVPSPARPPAATGVPLVGRFRRPLPPGHKAPTSPPPADPGRPPR